ncbi:MAG: 5-dehydro-4-deoxy-D-glucuronate isomerase [Cytophagaceae bacterium]|nr:5-dehydro-4-deoxy-D-glucuronate isomerase [Cytophagaceae bacterium]
MTILHACHPDDVRQYDTERLRSQFLVETLLEPYRFHFAYAHYDRFMVGGAVPIDAPMTLPAYPEVLKADFFLERRELGLVNVGGAGVVVADGEQFALDKLDGLYLGKGTREVALISRDVANPARFFMASAPAHHAYPNRRLTREEAAPVEMGTAEMANQRTIYKYIHAEGLASCQLIMGVTVLHPGSVWNTMPTHHHDRRMEAYFYFDLPENQRVFHLMGQPDQTRHLVVANEQAVFSPPWSIHSGCGTANYSFVWAMAGENHSYTDMEAVPVQALR